MIQRALAIVVDDDPSVCRALRRLLLAANLEVETHLSAQSFLDTVLHREPDCLVLDIRMPGMSGLDLHDRLQAMGRNIPVVFITAYTEDEDGLRDDGAEILRKPFGDQVLLSAIYRAIEKGTAR